MQFYHGLHNAVHSFAYKLSLILKRLHIERKQEVLHYSHITLENISLPSA